MDLAPFLLGPRPDANWSALIDAWQWSRWFETASEKGPPISSARMPFHGCQSATEQFVSTTRYLAFFHRSTTAPCLVSRNETPRTIDFGRVSPQWRRMLAFLVFAYAATTSCVHAA